MPAKLKIKEEPAIVADFVSADGAEAAARLSAVQAAKTAEAGAVNVDALGWRGTCAICLDLLPIDGAGQTFYSCCCKRLCTECSNECVKYDERYPLCREPGPKSGADHVRRLQTHVNKGNAEAQVQLGDAYRDSKGLKKSLKRAFQLYELAAAQGHARGQVKLGECYHHGNGVKINYKIATNWYRRAAERGYLGAQYSLGYMFYTGKGVAQSYDEAVKWWRLAAAQGFAEAFYNIGVCYANGHGVPRDGDEALRLYVRAAAKGSAEAAAAVRDLKAHRE